MDVTKLSAAKLRAEHDKRYEASHALTGRLIAAGYHKKTGRDLREMAKHGDPLGIEYVRTQDAIQETFDEMGQRARWHGSLKPIKRSA